MNTKNKHGKTKFINHKFANMYGARETEHKMIPFHRKGK